jgi:uncharacterized surface protein with fasciclin (FAS1) repeats
MTRRCEPVRGPAGHDRAGLARHDHASGRLKVAVAKMVQPDVEASNGVVHVIGQVILPPSA